MASLEQQVAQINGRYADRLRRIRADATMQIVERAQLPVASGGNMPVVTAKLKNSIRGAVNSIPTGASDSPAGAVARAGLGDEILIGWTANYAWVQEIRRGFMRLALTGWRDAVEVAAKRVR